MNGGPCAGCSRLTEKEMREEKVETCSNSKSSIDEFSCPNSPLSLKYPRRDVFSRIVASGILCACFHSAGFVCLRLLGQENTFLPKSPEAIFAKLRGRKLMKIRKQRARRDSTAPAQYPFCPLSISFFAIVHQSNRRDVGKHMKRPGGLVEASNDFAVAKIRMCMLPSFALSFLLCLFAFVLSPSSSSFRSLPLVGMSRCGSIF